MPDRAPGLDIPPPAKPAFRAASLIALRRPPVPRWPVALRAAVSMGVPAAIGWYLGDMPAGMMATIGAFTALYGNDRPFLNRAIHLAAIALSFALAVSIGVMAANWAWTVVPVITLIAITAAFLCNALRVGPPGAYMFVLACAAGTAMGAAHLAWWHVGGLVLAGGAFAWLMHMSGALFAPRGPEILALKGAARAVTDFLKASGTPRADVARHQAAMVLHQAWTVLVGQQPVQPRPDGTLSRLRAEGRELHMIFAEANATDTPPDAETLRRVHDIMVQTYAPRDVTDPGHVPLGRVSAMQLIEEGIRPGSLPFEVAVKVGIASAIAGLIGLAIHLEHAYWAIASAVLMLHQGLDWATTLQRGIQRVGGTLVGLLLAGAVLSLHPVELVLVAVTMLLQFTIEMLVMRNYGLAVVFITAVALTIASGGHPVADVGHLLWVRAEDTVIGCAVGLLVFAALARRDTSSTIAHELFRSWAAIDVVARHFEGGDATSVEARAARRNLQHHTILLLQAFDQSVGNSAGNRMAAEPHWPAIIATQRLAYRLLAAGWTIEEAAAAGDAMTTARGMFGNAGAASLHAALSDMMERLKTGGAAKPLPELPAFLSPEIALLSRSIVPASGKG